MLASAYRERAPNPIVVSNPIFKALLRSNIRLIRASFLSSKGNLIAWTRHSESCSQIPRYLRACDGSQKRRPAARFTDVDARHNRYDRRLRFLDRPIPASVRVNERIIADALSECFQRTGGNLNLPVAGVSRAIRKLSLTSQLGVCGQVHLPRNGCRRLELGPKGEATDHRLCFLRSIFLPISAQKSHVKPQNHLTPSNEFMVQA